MKTPLYALKSTWSMLLDILFPEKCLGCRITGDIICKDCEKSLRPTERGTVSYINTVYDYRDPVMKKAIWSLKYHKRSSIGQKLGRLMYENLIEEIADMRVYTNGLPIYVIPVPLSNKRQKMRGYNQVDMIARGFCSCADDNALIIKNGLIVKNKDTLPQARITNRNRRIQNAKDMFQICDQEFPRGKTFIVIDDVTTTGATMTEIVRLLKTSGALKVVGFTVAH